MIGQSEFREKDHCWPSSHPTFSFGEAVDVLPRWRTQIGGLATVRVVGWYKTETVPEGYCVESVSPKGITQNYPVSALKKSYLT